MKYFLIVGIFSALGGQFDTQTCVQATTKAACYAAAEKFDAINHSEGRWVVYSLCLSEKEIIPPACGTND